jgi:tetratricopeptide (TPR) repeat protein
MGANWLYHLPRITESQKRGRSGEHAIENRLSSFSNIMYPEHDLGIDYFCELIENNALTGKYFCVQAKETKRFDKCWRRSIKKETVLLWLNQRYPVFLMVYERSSRNCYWTSIQDIRQFLIDKMQDSSKSVRIKVDRSNLLLEDDENTAFVRKIESDGLLVNALYGIPEFISAGGYVGFIPVLSLTNAMRGNIRERVRFGMNYLINDYLLQNDLQHAYELSQILVRFDPRGHYDHVLKHARISRALGKREEAEKNYDMAISICKDDPNWNNRKSAQDPSIEDIIEMIGKEKLRFKTDSQQEEG